MRIYAPSRQTSKLDMPGQTQLKFRQPGQNTEEELRAGASLRSKLEEKERKHYLKTKSANFEGGQRADCRVLDAGSCLSRAGAAAGWAASAPSLLLTPPRLPLPLPHPLHPCRGARRRPAATRGRGSGSGG